MSRQGGDPGEEPVVRFQSKDQQAQDSGRANISVQVQRQGEKLMFQFEGWQAGSLLSYSGKGQSFRSIQAFG